MTPEPDRAPDPEVDPDDYRRVVGRLASGVTVVTTRVGSIDHAMTANAVISVSLDPVLMLVSVEREARFHDAVMESGVWSINVLHAGARAAATWLSTRGRPLHGQLDRVAHTRAPITGVAWLRDAMARFELRTADTHRAGDHTLLVGNVLSMQTQDDAQEALVYYRGQFGTLP